MDSVIELEPLLTPKQAAATLAVKPNTLAVWRCSKHQRNAPILPFVKVGDLVRYRPTDVAAFIEQQLQFPG